MISAEQNHGTDLVKISAESPSPFEAALIVNTCALDYKQRDLEINREKLTTIRKFLEEQKQQISRIKGCGRYISINFRKKAG